MESFIVYLFKVTICLVAFSVFFRLLLMRETFFRFTRLTMISGLIICSLLPFVKLKLDKSYAFQQTIYQLEETLLPEKPVENEIKPELKGNELVTNANPESSILSAQTTSVVKNEKSISWFSILITAYWLGIIVMFTRLAVSFTSLYRLFRKSRRIESGDSRLIISPENIVPFSFFRYIVLSEKDYRENPNEVILHEKMHILKKHNIDVVFSGLFLVVHWFNPMVWMLCRDLREIHEYEADNAVINSGIEAQQYQLLLVKKAVGERRFTSVVNSFNQSKIKNRITMMLKKESPKWARLKVLFALPLAAVALLAFAQPEIMEDRIIDYQSRKDATDYFLSIRKEQKEDYLAYLYLNTNDQLFLMQGNTEYVSMRAFDLKEKSDLTEIFADLIGKRIRETASTSVDFVLGGENDTKMKNVTLVRNAMREAYDRSCQTVSREKNISFGEVREVFPLTITYTSVQSGDTESITKQVRSNPFFYWEQMRKYYDEKGVHPENLDFGTSTNRKAIFILINSVNAIMYQGLEHKWFKAEEGLSDKSIETLKNMMVEMMKKNANGPVFFSLQHDESSSSNFVAGFLDSVLPVAYDGAISDASSEMNVSVAELREKYPLLLVYARPKSFSNLKSPNLTERRKTAKKWVEKGKYYETWTNSEEESEVIAFSGYINNPTMQVDPQKQKLNNPNKKGGTIVRLGFGLTNDETPLVVSFVQEALTEKTYYLFYYYDL